MKFSIRRQHLEACEGWLASAAVHLLFLIAFMLLIAPFAGNRSEIIEIETAFVDVGDELAIVELTALPTLEPDLPMVSEFMPVVDAELKVVHPGLVRSGGRGGDGTSVFNSGYADGLASRAGDANTASFFGTQAGGNRFVYVLDISSSMADDRIKRAMLELLRSIDELHEHQHFYVIAFSFDTHLMFDDGSLIPSPIPATVQNKQRLRGWLAQLQTAGGTDPRHALRIGLRLSPDAIFLLSDGEFNKPSTKKGSIFLDGSVINPADSVIDVVRNEKSDGLPIHTVAFENRKSESDMKEIATETHGMHRFVPAISAKVDKRPSKKSLRDAVMKYRFWGERGDVGVE